MQRNKNGRFAKGNGGGPGRPKKQERTRSADFHLMAVEPPEGCDVNVMLDWMRSGKWWAVDLGDGYYEVRTDDAIRESYIQFALTEERQIMVLDIRVARDLDFLNEPLHPDEAASV